MRPTDFTNEQDYWDAVHEETMGPSSLAEIDQYEANEKGRENPDMCWIGSDRDVWYRNPYYTGPEQPHPEEYPYEEVADES